MNDAPSRSASERRSRKGLNPDAINYQVGEAHHFTIPLGAIIVALFYLWWWWPR